MNLRRAPSRNSRGQSLASPPATPCLGEGYTSTRAAATPPGQSSIATARTAESRIADGSATIEDVGWELFRLMLEVASGRQKTWAEHWKLHNALVLFYPAPVT